MHRCKLYGWLRFQTIPSPGTTQAKPLQVKGATARHVLSATSRGYSSESPTLRLELRSRFYSPILISILFLPMAETASISMAFLYCSPIKEAVPHDFSHGRSFDTTFPPMFPARCRRKCPMYSIRYNTLKVNAYVPWHPLVELGSLCASLFLLGKRTNYHSLLVLSHSREKERGRAILEPIQ